MEGVQGHSHQESEHHHNEGAEGHGYDEHVWLPCAIQNVL